MSDWFDILYRRDSASPQDAVADAENSGVTPEVPHTAADTDRPRFKQAAPLKNLPGRWALEVQKVAIHLAPEDHSASYKSLLFSGAQKQSGTTTICYLVAHYLATERDDRRVLHVDFSTDPRRPAMAGTDLVLTTGQSLPERFFADIGTTFTRVAIRPGTQHSVAVSASWVREFITMTQRYCEWIFIDAPPFYVAPESYGVAKACDGVILVLKSGESRYPALNALVADLDALGIRTIGTVLNFRQYPIPRWLLKYI